MFKEELLKREENLRKKIKDAIDEFEEETGLCVKEINLTHKQINGILENYDIHINNDVHIKIG